MAAVPGFARQTQYRTAFRAAGVVLLVVGLSVFVWGIRSFMGAEDMPSGLSVVAFLGGFLVAAFGVMCLQAGFVGAGARYAAGETMPVVKDSLDYLKAGPFCSKCGVRNDADAKFCDSCGATLS